MTYDFKQIVNCIFINKQDYKNISDKDKITNFFIINRKFSKQYPKKSEDFNHKYIDKPSSIDEWFNFFSNIRGTPSWYWDDKNRKKNLKEKSENKKKYEILREREELSENDIDFLNKYYDKELKKELKTILIYSSDIN
jgi:hypothetical protein